MNKVYFGRSYDEDCILDALKKFSGLTYEKSPNIQQETAGFIAEGYIIGWFQGRAEFGPRALGNRSILADPRKADMKDIINAKVKFREFFRPFAPSVLWEYQQEYFDLDIKNPYMLIVRDVKEDKRSVIPAVTHVDNSGRLQTVLKEENPVYYQLISEFKKITGVPVVLDTSFNIKGEPIVETPEDAIRCFLGTQIDILVLGDYLVKKKEESNHE